MANSAIHRRITSSMAQQYWVGEFFIDLSRNQISRNNQSKTLAPKALSVLTYLARHQGQVVSYEELLDEVWTDSVVTPNTLQRSIAQLRKALGESSKEPVIIKTHSKQGYSLDCDVNWFDKTHSTVKEIADSDEIAEHNNEVNAPSPKHTQIKAPHHQHLGKVSTKVRGVLVVAIAAVLFFVFRLLQPTPQLQFHDLRYITATDKKEYGATYSPDGEYILFHRYFDKVCVNNIWARNTETHQEFQLVANDGTYDGLSLSPDGKNLIYIAQEDCTKPTKQNICYNLMQLDFAAALKSPQTPKTLLECKNSAIRTPTWVDENHILLLQKAENRWQLTRYSIDTNSSISLYQVEGGNIVSFKYSNQHHLLAVISIKSDGKQYIEMLSVTGDLISSHVIGLPKALPQHPKLYFDFAPNSEQLVFGYNRNLYSLTYTGDVEKLDFPFDQGVGAPSFHPNGDHVLLIKGQYDSDVASMALPEPKTDLESPLDHEVSYSVFERSNAGEDYAKHQPNGDLVAFISGRTGKQQVWLKAHDNVRRLSHFPSGSFIRDISWSHDGESLLALVNQKLHYLFLNSESQAIELGFPIFSLFHWDNKKQIVIANILLDGISQFVEIDLYSREYQIINHKSVYTAAKSASGPLIFTDRMFRFWQRVAIEEQQIDKLSDQGSSKRFVVKSEMIYGINKNNQLWSYNLETQAFTVLASVPSDIDYITDINDNELYITVVVAAKKEVIELSVAH